MIDIIKILKLKRRTIPISESIQHVNQAPSVTIVENRTVFRAILCFISFNLTVILILTYFFCKSIFIIAFFVSQM